MTISLPDLDLIVTRLKSVDGLRLVEQVATVLAAVDQTRVSPAAMVYPVGLTPQPNRIATGMVRQAAAYTVGVALTVSKAGPKGAGGLDVWQPLIDRVLTSLVGWRHTGATGITQAGAGRLLTFDIDRQLMIWEQRFTLPCELRQTEPVEPEEPTP